VLARVTAAVRSLAGQCRSGRASTSLHVIDIQSRTRVQTTHTGLIFLSPSSAAAAMASQAQIPSVRKAWRVISRGTPYEALALEPNLPVPSQLKQGDVLIKVQAAALNPAYVSSFFLIAALVELKIHVPVDTNS
jgi:hypothetical protein